MTAARPYFLIGRRALDRIEAQARQALVELAAAWWPDAIDIRIDASVFDSAAELPQAARYCVQRDEKWLALFAAEREWQALTEAWLGCAMAPSSELGQVLIQRFCSELLPALAADSGAGMLQEGVRREQLPGYGQPGAGLVRCKLRLGAVNLTLLTSAALWPALREALPAPTPCVLVPCGAALGETRITVRAWLPAVQVPLTDMATLAVGDFLCLGLDLSGAVVLRSENSQLALAATIGRSGDRKAVQLCTSPSSAQKPQPNPAKPQPIR